MLVVASVILWIGWIRPYISKNRRSFAHGANLGWAILADASMASDIAKENKFTPWFLKVFWTIEALTFLLPIVLFVAMACT